MPTKRNDVEERSAVDREVGFTRVTLAWVFVLIILFVVTSTPSSTESRSVHFSIRASFGGGDASTQGEGECADCSEMLRASLPMAQVFDVARAMMGEAWADPKPFEMTATFADEDGKARLTMRMVFVSAEARNQNVRDYGSIEAGKQTLARLAEVLAEHLSTRTNGGVQ
jgi:hypothetical protein